MGLRQRRGGRGTKRREGRDPGGAPEGKEEEL